MTLCDMYKEDFCRTTDGSSGLVDYDYLWQEVWREERRFPPMQARA